MDTKIPQTKPAKGSKERSGRSVVKDSKDAVVEHRVIISKPTRGPKAGKAAKAGRRASTRMGTLAKAAQNSTKAELVNKMAARISAGRNLPNVLEDDSATGIAVNALIDTFKAHTSALARRAIIRTVRQRLQDRSHVFGLANFTDSGSDTDEMTAACVHLQELTKPVSVNVSTARSSVGIGAILDQAKDSVQVLSNDRTHTTGYVFSEEQLTQLLDSQVAIVVSEAVATLFDDLSDQLEAQSAAQARARFLEVSRHAEPIKVDVPVPSSGPPSAEIEV